MRTFQLLVRNFSRAREFSVYIIARTRKVVTSKFAINDGNEGTIYTRKDGWQGKGQFNESVFIH